MTQIGDSVAPEVVARVRPALQGMQMHDLAAPLVSRSTGRNLDRVQRNLEFAQTAGWWPKVSAFCSIV